MSYLMVTSPEAPMQISPTFTNHLQGRADVRRVSFQFSAQGTDQAGVLYVTMNVDGDPMNSAEKAAKIACKRAGATDATLHAIVAPMR